MGYVYLIGGVIVLGAIVFGLYKLVMSKRAKRIADAAKAAAEAVGKATQGK